MATWPLILNSQAERIAAPARTMDELLTAMAGWQLDADMIHCIAEDLPGGAMAKAANALFGEDGEKFTDLVVSAVNVGCDDDILWFESVNRHLHGE